MPRESWKSDLPGPRDLLCYTGGMTTGVIYGIVCQCPRCDPSEVRYVGQTINLRSRRAAHKTPSGAYTTPRYKFVHSHGSNNIDLVVLESGVEERHLNDREKHWIKTLNTYVLRSERGLNATEGGDPAEWDAEYYEGLRATRKDLNWAARKMTWGLVRELRDEYREEDTPLKELAEKFDISETTMHKILKNQLWYDERYTFERRDTSKRDYNYGEKAFAAKMTWGKVHELRERYAQGEPTSNLAKEFGVSQGVASKIGKGVTWRTEDYNPPNPEELEKLRSEWYYTHTYTKEFCDQIRKDHVAGKTYRQIRREYSISPEVARMVLSNKLHPNDEYVKPRAKNGSLTKDERSRMDDEILSGKKSSSEIAKSFGVSKQTVLVRKREII